MRFITSAFLLATAQATKVATKAMTKTKAAVEVTWEINEQCTDVEGVADAWGDDCADYTNNSWWCHNYDDDVFISGDACCVCGGGNTCSNSDDGPGDVDGDTCADYVLHPNWCGGYDHADWSSADCCACQGDHTEDLHTEAPAHECYEWNGQQWQGEAPSNPAWTVCGLETCTACGSDYTQCYEFTGGPGVEVDCFGEGHPENVHDGGMCIDVEDATDSWGDYCWEYAEYPSWCGGYDDDDFVSSRDCCACGGGLGSGLGSGPTCSDSDDGPLDSWGDSCADYQGNEHWCGGYNTSEFDSANCCACH